MNVPVRGGVNRTANDSAWLDQRREARAYAAPPVHAIVVALELHAMPMNRGALGQSIDDGDLDGFAAAQHNRRPRHRYGARWLGSVAFAEIESVRR